MPSTGSRPSTNWHITGGDCLVRQRGGRPALGEPSRLIRLSTSRRIFASPLSPADAMAVVESWLAQPAAVTLDRPSAIPRCCVACSNSPGRQATSRRMPTWQRSRSSMAPRSSPSTGTSNGSASGCRCRPESQTDCALTSTSPPCPPSAGLCLGKDRVQGLTLTVSRMSLDCRRRRRGQGGGPTD